MLTESDLEVINVLINAAMSEQVQLANDMSLAHLEYHKQQSQRITRQEVRVEELFAKSNVHHSAKPTP